MQTKRKSKHFKKKLVYLAIMEKTILKCVNASPSSKMSNANFPHVLITLFNNALAKFQGLVLCVLRWSENEQKKRGPNLHASTRFF